MLYESRYFFTSVSLLHQITSLSEALCLFTNLSSPGSCSSSTLVLTVPLQDALSAPIGLECTFTREGERVRTRKRGITGERERLLVVYSSPPFYYMEYITHTFSFLLLRAGRRNGLITFTLVPTGGV